MNERASERANQLRFPMLKALRRVRNACMGKNGVVSVISSDAERDSGFYDGLYARGDVYRQDYARSHYYFLMAVISDRLRRGGMRSVLEVGCGSGALAQLLQDQGVTQYLGFDFSPKAVDLARQRVPSWRFEVDDARTSSLYAQGPFDAVVCTEVLEHIEDDLIVVQRFPVGTRCLCSVPNFPYESHVRFFQSSDDVVDRYGRFFDGFEVATFRSPMSQDDLFFLFDGVKTAEPVQ